MKMFRISGLLLMACAMVFMFAQHAAAADRIRAIKVEGVQRIEPATVLSYIDVQAGDDFDADRLNEALKSLFATGLFADVSLYQEASDLVIVVVENPIINEIRFEGNDEVKTDLLMSEVQLRPRTVLTRTKVQADVERLEMLYRLSGRFSASVDPKIIKLDQNRVNLIYEVNEGPETLITRISFLGNKRFDDSQLQAVVRSQEERWWRIWSSDDKYDPDRLNYDRELLRKYYLDNGYADFQVENATAELSPDRKNFYVTFTLNEGERYKVGTIDVKSNIAGLDGATLKKVVTFSSGEWYRASNVEKTVEKLTDELGNRQYAFVSIAPGVDRDREGKLINIVFTVNPGRKIFVENININGNMRTLDEVVRREMTLIEGDPFNTEKMKESEQRIKDLGFFETVSVKPEQGGSPDKADINVNVAEKSTGSLSVGAGYSTTDGALGDFRISERNFLGKGQELSLSTTLSAERSEFDFSFTEPYFLKRDLSAGIDLFHITRDYQDESSFDSQRSGGGLRLGYPLSDKWRQSIGYSYTLNEIRNVPAGASVYIQQQEGEYTTSLFGQRVVYDNTNSKLEPTEGLKASIGTDISGLGGDSRYMKVRVGGDYYYPILDKWILNIAGEAGLVAGYGGKNVRINERFYLGGDNVRGFADAGIGPRDLATDDNLGGNQYWRGSIQVAFPSGLPEDLGVRAHVFSDFGALWNVDDSGPTVADDSTIRASLGFGVSWRSPMGPVTADFAVPVAKEDYDDEEMFRFKFGTKF